MPFSNLGSQSVIAGTAGTALTVPSGTRYVLIDTGGAVTWRDDGTWTAGGTVAGAGMQMAAADPPLLYDGDATKLVFVGTGGTVNVTYHG